MTYDVKALINGKVAFRSSPVKDISRELKEWAVDRNKATLIITPIL